MKKFPILIVTFVALLGFNSCSSDDDVVFIAQPDPEGISFINTFNSQYILTQETAENNAERFVWNEIDVEVPTNLSYELQGSADSGFDSYDVMGSTGDNNLAVTVGQLMELAEDAGLDNDPATEDMPNNGQLYFRVVASAGEVGGLAHTSEVESITVVLPEAAEEEEDLRELYFVGDATAAGWNPNNNNAPLFRDGENPDVYYYTGRFAGGSEIEGFKLIEILGEWQPQWGGTDGNLAVNNGDGQDPTAFSVNNDSYYSLMLDLENMSYTWEEYDVSSDDTYATIGVLGDATAGGWETDMDLTQSDFDPHIWYANDVTLSDGVIKFRAEDAWDVNWGTDSGALSDITTLGGPDMPVEEGVYDIWFNDITGRYILIPQGEE